MSDRREVGMIVAKSLPEDAPHVIRAELARIAATRGYVLDGELRVGETRLDVATGGPDWRVMVSCYAIPRDTPTDEVAQPSPFTPY